MNFNQLFSKKKSNSLNNVQLKAVANLIKQKPELLQKFNDSYNNAIQKTELNESKPTNTPKTESTESVDQLIKMITQELIDLTPVYMTDSEINPGNITDSNHPFTTPSCFESKIEKEVIDSLPIQLKPQLTAKLQKSDLAHSGLTYMTLLYYYSQFKEKRDIQMYHKFRQGLDLLDLDDITYKMLSENPNKMSNWLPKIIDANKKSGSFFKIPKTTIAKVPQSILQLTRLDYSTLTQTTHKIVNLWAESVFNLKQDGDYFVKTGTFSSKFDFRNARVNKSEIKELGDYLLFLQHQATNMAGFHPNAPSIYGMSTTNEFVVREFIQDSEKNPTIYKGLPLRTEFRLFIDFDTNEILGASPYWREDIMKDRFGNSKKFQIGLHEKHDYVTYTVNQEKLNTEFNLYVESLKTALISLSQECEMSGQWSVDIMKNETDFYLIDMAILEESALNDVVPKHKIKPMQITWIKNAIDSLTIEMNKKEKP